MVRCFSEDALLDIVEGRCPIDAAAEQHLATCDDCRIAFAAGARDGATHREPSVATAPEGEPSWEELGEGVVVASTYELERFLGAGGSGVVWAARDVRDGSYVALKVARDRDPVLRRRFDREGRVAARFVHPNVARIYDVVPETATRGPCLALELVLGETLDARLQRDRTLPLREASRLLLPVARALAAAHAHGIVHRDVKPQNVMLAPDRVVVLDFGIAKLLPSWGPHTKLTRPGAALGTPRYMAPEQVFGEPQIDARADIWALGATTFRLLSGAPPVDATTIGELTKAFAQGRVRSTFEHPLPPDVREVVGAALVIPREARLADITRFEAVFSRYAA